MNKLENLLGESFAYYLILRVIELCKGSLFFSFGVKVKSADEVKPFDYKHSLIIRTLRKIDAHLAKLDKFLYKFYKASLFGFIFENFVRLLNESFIGQKLKKLSGTGSLRVYVSLIPILYLYIDFFFRNGGVFVSLSKFWDEIALVFVYAFIMLDRVRKGGRYKANFNYMGVVAFLYVISGVLHMFAKSPDPGIAVEGFRVVFQQVLWYFALAELIRTKNDAVFAVKTFNMIGLALGLHAVYQFIFRVRPLGNWVDVSESLRTRAFAVTTSPNILGSLFVMLLPLAVGLFFYAKPLLSKLFYLVCFLVMAAGLVFTYSRGAWLSAAFCFLATAVMIDLRFAFIFAAAGVFGITALNSIRSRLFVIFSPIYLAKASKNGRLFRWKKGLLEWDKDRMFGAGLGQFGGAAAMNNFPERFYIDNYYLKTLTETGYFGIGSLIFMVAAFIFTSLKIINNQTDKSEKLLVLSVFAGGVGVLIHNFVENIFEVPAMIVYFWSFIAIINAFEPPEKEAVYE